MRLTSVELEYPVDSVPRYGHGRPPHALLRDLLNRRRDSYRELMERLMDRFDGFRFERNDFLAPMDAFALHGLLALYRPKKYIEVGSGESTKFARRAITHFRLETALTSIDPNPRASIDALCDRVVRQPLEEVDLSIFEELQAGDFLFIDNSHRALMNSDVVVTFLDVLPRLSPGVLIHLHDIYLPGDYPHEWAHRGYSEQYLLASWLLGGSSGLRVLLPAAFITHDPALSACFARLWESLPGQERGGVSFWAETTARLE